MAREARAESIVPVLLLDMDRIAAKVTAEIGDQLADNETVRLSRQFGIVRTERGTFALCTEGVGGTKSIEDAELTIEVHTKTHEGENKIRSSLIPRWTFTMDADQVAEYVTDERVYLHEFIRSFGGRLENNFRSWERALTA